MKNKKTIVLLLSMSFGLGILTERKFHVSKNVDTKLIATEEMKQNSSSNEFFTKTTSEVKMNKIEKCHNLNQVKSSKWDSGEDDFDEYEWKEKEARSLNEWNDSVKNLFHERMDDPEKAFEIYLSIKSSLEKELNEHWDNIMEKTRISENSFLGTSTYQDELKEMKIKVYHHKKLKKMLGNSIYKDLQGLVNTRQRQAVEDAKNGKVIAPVISF